MTVHAPAAEIAKRLPWAGGALEPIDAQRCEYRTSDDDLEWLAIRIAMLGVDVDVHEPPELIARLDVLARRLRRATGIGLSYLARFAAAAVVRAGHGSRFRLSANDEGGKRVPRRGDRVHAAPGLPARGSGGL